MFLQNAPDPLNAQLAIHRVKATLHHIDGPKLAHAFGFVRVVHPQLGLDVALKGKMLGDDAHKLVTADSRLPVTFNDFRIALDERLARHGYTIGPAVRL